MTRKKKEEVPTKNESEKVILPDQRSVKNQLNSFKQMIKETDFIALGPIPAASIKFTESFVKDSFSTFRYNSFLNDKQLMNETDFYKKKIDEIDHQLLEKEQKLNVDERKELKQQQEDLYKRFSDSHNQVREQNNTSNKQNGLLLGGLLLAAGGLAISIKNSK